MLVYSKNNIWNEILHTKHKNIFMILKIQKFSNMRYLETAYISGVSEDEFSPLSQLVQVFL